MEGHAKKCVGRYCELVNRTTQQLYKVATPCTDDHHFKEEELKSVGELSKVCSKIVLKCLYLARIGRPDILWSVNKFARAVTKWTKACDRRLARLISCIHHTLIQTIMPQQCTLGLFQDSDVAGDLEDSKSTSGGVLCIFGSRTFVPISWMCKKQTSVSHRSVEAEVFSLDAGLRMDGIPALDLWDLVIEVFHSFQTKSTKPEMSETHAETCRQFLSQTCENKFQPRTTNPDLPNIDHVPSSGTHTGFNAMLYVSEDHEAVVEMKI